MIESKRLRCAGHVSWQLYVYIYIYIYILIFIYLKVQKSNTIISDQKKKKKERTSVGIQRLSVPNKNQFFICANNLNELADI